MMDDLYGAAIVSVQNGKLFLKFNDAAQGELENWEKDTFRMSWTNPLFLESVGKPPMIFQVEKLKSERIENAEFSSFSKSRRRK